MKKQAYNPYLPSWEYIPDGEPYVFDGRVYIYGSHDFANGHVFCQGDYICYSAPVDHLEDWRYEGVIYEKTKDPFNRDGKMCLYAPDVCKGVDGRYYLYYVLDRVSVVSVAVCDTPAGKYEFFGYVHYEDGTRYGDKETDEPQFDPGVIREGEITYLYTGFCGPKDKSRHGAMVVALGPDMLTITKGPKFVAPGQEYSENTGFEGHAFFEAPSIRKRNNIYYLIYSSQVMHELCYATSDNPMEGFIYQGVIVSNCDIGIDSYKPAELPMAYGANNHGSIVEIGEEWYIFYHRHTNNTWYSRQGCAEKITFTEEGKIPQVPITSCGLNKAPLEGIGEYPSYIACHNFGKEPSMYVGKEGAARVVQLGKEGDEEIGFVANITDGTTLGFKSFLCSGVKALGIWVHGYGNGTFHFKTAYDGPIIGSVTIHNCNIWEYFEAPVDLPDGVRDIYISYEGDGCIGLRSFCFVK